MSKRNRRAIRKTDTGYRSRYIHGIPYAEMAEGSVEASIDGISVSVDKETTILEAAESWGIHIPTLCFLKGISRIGSCRVCSVEVKGQNDLVPACNTRLENGMEIYTGSERVHEYRRVLLDLIISEHGLNSTNYCFSCSRNGTCELQAVCREENVETPTFRYEKDPEEILDSNPFLRYDPKLCIRCQRCVGACNSQAYNHTLTTGKQGIRTTILAPFGPDWKSTDCEVCGCCAQACPTGALTEKRHREWRPWEVERVLTTCPHCGVGCQINLIVKDGRLVDVTGADGPSNETRLCV
ncbi:MAG: 2Fe-2S iron-sulfur cluster-binding protein [Eggerthellaceae bacterium]|nr:2Fe-2S iron-sulfur cluster-binding protein [Eggerthellaceae bacterium]